MRLVQVPMSIGSNCRPHFQIGRYMGQAFPHYQPPPFFFDKLGAGDLPGVIKLVERDFRLAREDLYVFEGGGQFVPRDRASGMAFLHDFGCPNRLWDDRDACEAAMLSECEASLAKYQGLAENTRRVLAGPLQVALVYLGTATRDGFLALKSVLRERYGKDFLILNVLEQNLRHLAVTDGTVVPVFVNDAESPKRHTPQEWQGWDASWAAALSCLPLDGVPSCPLVASAQPVTTDPV